MTGLLGAATLLGILVGAPVFGRLTDRYGRRALMIADLAVFVVASLAQLVVTNVWQLIALRFVLGVAIGADYPIAGALIAEFAPARMRGAAVNGMQVAWFFGAMMAYVVGYALLGTGPQSRRWILREPSADRGDRFAAASQRSGNTAVGSGASARRDRARFICDALFAALRGRTVFRLGHVAAASRAALCDLHIRARPCSRHSA